MMIDGRTLDWDDFAPSEAVDPDWVVSGSVEEAGKALYASENHKFVVQVWECRTAVELNIDSYPVDEFATIISGEVELTDSQSVTRTYGAGDSFLIPKGFVGKWSQKGPLRKYAVCHLEES
jgi:hypothetical protein